MTSFAYTYDLDGYVTEVERENGDTISCDYDGVGRLIDEHREASGSSTVYRNQFQYDPVGNRTRWVRTEPHPEGGTATSTHDYSYNSLNQLVEERLYDES
jgi:YD repeat-containing protein